MIARQQWFIANRKLQRSFAGMTIEEMMEQQPLGNLLRLYAAYEIWQDDPSVGVNILHICDERTDDLQQQIMPLLAKELVGVPKKQHLSVFRALINKFTHGPDQRKLKALVNFEKR